MCNDELLLEKIAYVLASEHRKNILLYLEDEMHTPKQIGDAINVRTKPYKQFVSTIKKKRFGVLCHTKHT